MPFYQRRSSKTYHTKTTCSRVPRNVKTNVGWSVRGSKPKGKMCVECAAKEKPKAKPKRRVAAKKMTRKKMARKRPTAKKKATRARKR